MSRRTKTAERLPDQPLGNALTRFIRHDQSGIHRSHRDAARLHRKPVSNVIVSLDTPGRGQAANVVDRSQSRRPRRPAEVNAHEDRRTNGPFVTDHLRSLPRPPPLRSSGAELGSPCVARGRGPMVAWSAAVPG